LECEAFRSEEIHKNKFVSEFFLIPKSFEFFSSFLFICPLTDKGSFQKSKTTPFMIVDLSTLTFEGETIFLRDLREREWRGQGDENT